MPAGLLDMVHYDVIGQDFRMNKLIEEFGIKPLAIKHRREPIDQWDHVTKVSISQEDFNLLCLSVKGLLRNYGITFYEIQKDARNLYPIMNLSSEPHYAYF